MPRVTTIANGLRPYVFHGMELGGRSGESQAFGECPFCMKEKKFYVNLETGQWDCKVCSLSGNAVTFIRLLHERSETSERQYATLAANRKLKPATIVAWGVRASLITGEWLVPGWGTDGSLNQLYRYTTVDGRKRLLATPGMKHYLHGVNLLNRDAETVYICEGVWDGMALWESLRHVKIVDGEGKASCFPGASCSVQATKITSLSAGQSVSVIAVPSCSTFMEQWCEVCSNKVAVLLYDNDYPGRHPRTGKEMEPAALNGMRKAAGVMVGSQKPPKEVYYLRWGENGYDKKLPNGHDVRDFLTKSPNHVANVGALLRMVAAVPSEWKQRLSEGRASYTSEISECTEWETLVTAWRKALVWTKGLDRMLSVMLSSVLSTRSAGDQLWIKGIGPAASGKSTLCEALSTNKKYVEPKSIIRGFHSGFKMGGDGEDSSLLGQLHNKTLVTKDGDTLLQSPNLRQILSEARDIYDRVSRTYYRNRVSRDYEGINMTWILCGTESLRALDDSELGERFLDCVVVEEIDEDEEDDAGWRKINQVTREITLVSNGQVKSNDSPELEGAKKLTGGYIEYLCANAERLLSAMEMNDEVKRQCQKLGKFVAYMRARPSSRQKEKVQREMSYRLISQLGRLAWCLGVVRNKKEVDGEVMEIVRQVALDTCRGRTLNIVKILLQNVEGISAWRLAVKLGSSENDVGQMLTFMKHIGIADLVESDSVAVSRKPRWRLTQKMAAMCREVMRQ
jgi:acetolactate synthase small subunit